MARRILEHVHILTKDKMAYTNLHIYNLYDYQQLSRIPIWFPSNLHSLYRNGKELLLAA